MSETVKIWEEKIKIPTYGIGKPEKNPMFFEKRVYQGSSGVVYPNAIIEKIEDTKENKEYHAVFAENEYIKIMVLPELGGRIQMAFDKIRQRHFVYYNSVIKPALVGLTGPWISGGIEFNWPQHHRPSTFEKVDHFIEENKDGSKTIWVNEVERMTRTKGMAGFTLYPGKAYIEIKGRLFNRTPFPQTFLWWANPAVSVDENYQSVFPPDVNAVFDHGRRDVSSFPIATGVYYKVDYAPGTDISRYSNIPVPTSFMAVESSYDFIGGYEHDTKAGLLHVADHHIAPGKKQWTWGNGEFGQAWDRNLTDEDGPYIELMTGVFTDNQPDFSWLMPNEEKTFTQYFMPYSEVGMVKNATKEAVVNIEWKGDAAEIRLYVTSKFEKLKIALFENETEIFDDHISCSPDQPYLKNISFPNAIDEKNCKLLVEDLGSQRVLVAYQPLKKEEKEPPTPAVSAKEPSEITSIEELYLTGLHIEQYRHATRSAADYYEEALHRKPTDSRNNNALGLWYLRRGQFDKAETYLRIAVKTLIDKNPNPYNGEPYYNLGWSLILQNKMEEAFDMFYKSVWNDGCQHSGYLNLARIAVGKNDFETALDFVKKSLVKNYHSHTARHLKTVLLRKLNRRDEAMLFLGESLKIDPFNFGCLFEKWLMEKEQDSASADRTSKVLRERSHDWVHNFIEYAFDYAHAGLYGEAEKLLVFYGEANGFGYPMLCYYLGWFAYMGNRSSEANMYFEQAALANPDYCFPNRIEDVNVLRKATELNPADAKAYYYLGNFWYDKRQYNEAIECWEKSVLLESGFPTVHRNLSLAYFNKLKDQQKALQSLEKAFELDIADGRVLMELDQLRKILNHPSDQRLAILEQYLNLTLSRDDLYLERITLYNQLGNYEKAKALIHSRKFHPWEGGEGKAVAQYLICYIELAKKAIRVGDYQEALQLLSQASKYPPNLGEGKLINAQENDIHYLSGIAHELLGNKTEANKFYRMASAGEPILQQAIFYNDPQPDKILYQGLAWLKMGEKEKAMDIFKKLIDFGNQHLNDNIKIDYFAVSLPDLLVFDVDLNLRNKIHCMYMMGLGHLGMGGKDPVLAKGYFDKVLELDINHQGASTHNYEENYFLYTDGK
ncbi:MAG: DUF5107 domain-containing protein [Bacteroidetes bacterium]|nr:DUF5107 domain-containing protein [Bacteroidota bacterium]